MEAAAWHFDLGANPSPDGGTRFRIWAPKATSVSVLVLSGQGTGTFPLQPEERGYFSATIPCVADGDHYLLQPDNGTPRPDPVSRFQPEGIGEASQVVDPRLYAWQDEEWNGISLEDHVVYEIHVGTFTREGTFEAVIPFLDYLLELGITALELMPVSQFPGGRNWGYDGVCHFAPQNTYGGPDGLKRLINACHRKGLAVIMDVVYNHFGPEGNHMADFGHYFTEMYHTPWGGALNFDGPHSDPVREYFIGNALYWLEEFHIDGLRLDAVDWIFDKSAKHFLRELAEEVHGYGVKRGRRFYLFAENDTNDVRLINSPEIGGHGLDVQWDDNFHHALRTLLTGETTGYYEDFGQFSQLVKAYAEAFVYTGQYSRYRQRRHGAPAGDRPTSQFLVFSQNHDQIGNRKCGDRLSTHQSLEKLLLTAGVVLLSPYLPLIFMGEEYGEKACFHYFVSHSDPDLIAAVRRGKHEEHASGICEGEIPDPASESTFLESKLDLTQKREGEQALILEFYRLLLSLRKRLPALRVFQRQHMEVVGLQQQRILALRRQAENSAVLCVFSFSNTQEQVALNFRAGSWEKILESSGQHWRGPGEVAPASVIVADAGETSTILVNPFSLLVYASGT